MIITIAEYQSLRSVGISVSFQVPLVTFDTSSIFPRVIRPKMYKDRSKIARLFRQKFANELRRECDTKLTKRKHNV